MDPIQRPSQATFALARAKASAAQVPQGGSTGGWNGKGWKLKITPTWEKGETWGYKPPRFLGFMLVFVVCVLFFFVALNSSCRCRCRGP